MKKKILFVDDEINFLQAISRSLRDQRRLWEIHHAESVDEALFQMRLESFDAVVSDVMMPDKTGFDLLDAMQQDDKLKLIPVVILTGSAEADIKRKALDLGAADLLNKPVNPEDLIARVKSVLRLKWHQDELHNYSKLLERKIKERTLELEWLRRDLIWRLAKTGELRDEDTGDHVIRVACCCMILAGAFGLPAPDREAIFITSPLHDIGKIGIPDSILLKNGPLDAEEWQLMTRHCAIGYSILMENPKGLQKISELDDYPFVDLEHVEDPIREMAATIALSHHEKWDGSGYPKGLKGREIPLPGRIVAVCDVFDALRSKRPYKEAFSVEKSLTIMRNGLGIHFDPDLYDAFEKLVDRFEEIRRQYSR